ncbi:MAG: TlpA family protein disulfide reductase [Rhodospirillales bacterium]|nr:TlpA family protein disulfide reductase [Rhodospirillales bacterium]
MVSTLLSGRRAVFLLCGIMLLGALAPAYATDAPAPGSICPAAQDNKPEAGPLFLSTKVDDNVFVMNYPPAPFSDSETTLYDEADNPHALKDVLKGHYSLINFWATWCTPCVLEMPTLSRLSQTPLSETFQVVFISMDYPENAASLKAKMAQSSLPEISGYYTAVDDRLWRQIMMYGVPSSYLINPDGEVVYTITGGVDWMAPDVLSFLKMVIDQDNG